MTTDTKNWGELYRKACVAIGSIDTFKSFLEETLATREKEAEQRGRSKAVDFIERYLPREAIENGEVLYMSRELLQNARLLQPVEDQKGCCGECFLPERDGSTFHSHAAGYALPEGCKDEDCECHKKEHG